MGTLRRVRVRQCLNRRSCGLGWCFGGPRHCCIRWGPRRATGRGGFGGFLFPIFKLGNAIGSPTVKYFRFVCENLTTFPFGKHTYRWKARFVGFLAIYSVSRWKLGLWEISKKSNDCSTRTYAATLAATSIFELDCAWPWLCVLA